MEGAKQKYIIAGGGTAGWSAAAALSKFMSHFADIILIESDNIGTVGVGEATIPPIRTFQDILGIEEGEFLKASNATFKLGIKFENWTNEESSYYHAFGVTGQSHWAASFQHYWLSAKSRGCDYRFDSFNSEACAAENKKFSRESGLTYAYHFDSGAYAKFLRGKCERAGVKRIEGTIKSVNQDGLNGNITSLQLDDGQVIDGDFFIDCTGFRALLIGETLKAEYEDWSGELFCNRAIAVQTELTSPPIPYTRAIAHKAGWQWRIPLVHRGGNGIVYSSQYMDDEEALDTLLTSVEGQTISNPNHIRFKPGMRREHWKNNCLAVGLAAGFLEPLESTSIYFIHETILKFVRHNTGGLENGNNIQVFNEKVCQEWDLTKDFIVLHYWLNQRTEEFWVKCRETAVNERISESVKLFSDTGSVPYRRNLLFEEESWVQVMMGQGVLPDNWHPLTNAMSDNEMIAFLEGLKGPIQERISGIPAHGEYLEELKENNYGSV